MRFGEYEKIEMIGRGSSGFVYKVCKGGMLYAVKACTGFDKESLSRFDREIRIAQSLNHFNVVHVYDYDMNASNPYFVMELCDGPINNALEGKSYEDLLGLAVQICQGVIALHDVDVLHRDIKPSNILIKDGVVKLTDFSFVFFLNHESLTLTATNQVIGTYGYIAPEIYRNGGHYATKQTDIYSLGCTLWYLFSDGISPNYYDAHQIDPRIARVIEKCRDNDPDKRYQTAKDLLDDLIALQLPLQYLGIRDLLDNSGTLSKAEVRTNAFHLLMKNSRWDELIEEIRLLKPERLNDIVRNEPGAASQILLLLDNIYHNDKDTQRQFEDVDVFTSLCSQIFNASDDVLIKEKALDLTLELSIFYNRWPAMRTIRENMLNKLTAYQVRMMSGYLLMQKDNLQALESSLGVDLPRSVRIAAGIN
ncbi:MAG: serine/threonine protein kinase [Bacteroidales bacterium]|nr:serine/threonine protein kinase [Bacteroidales bacterium]